MIETHAIAVYSKSTQLTNSITKALWGSIQHMANVTKQVPNTWCDCKQTVLKQWIT